MNQLEQDEPAMSDLTFVSWNVHVGGADIDRFVRDLESGHLLGGRRPGPITLMLQEAVRSEGVPQALPAGASAAGWIGSADSERRSEIGELAKRLGASVFYAPSMRNGTASTWVSRQCCSSCAHPSQRSATPALQ